MAFKFSKGVVVKQVLSHPIEGTVADFELDRTTGEILAKVEWTDQDGHVHSRFFREEDLEEKEKK